VIGLIAGDDAAEVAEARVLEQPEEVTGVVDRGGNQDGPRSLLSRGFSAWSSMMLAMMRCLRSPELISSSDVAQRLRRTAF
jgi:hypothetical protein